MPTSRPNSRSSATAARIAAGTIMHPAETAPGNGEIFAMLDDLSDSCVAATEDGKLCYANEAARELLHLKGRVTGRKLSLVLADRKALDLFEEAIRAGRPRVRSLSLTLSGDGSRNYRLSMVPVRLAGGEAFVRIAIRRQDIVPEPATSESGDPRMESMQRMGDPLTIIQGYLENLLDGVIRDPVVMRQCLSAMQRQAAQIQRLLSSFSK